MNRDEKGESKRRPAAAGGRRRQGRQQRTGAEKAARAGEVGAWSSNGVQRGVLDHPRANTSVQERKAPEQHPQHGVEGRAPHRAEAFVAMRKSEDRKQDVTTLHTTRHDNRAVARYNQIPGGRNQQKTDWTRKPQGTNRGGGQEGGGTLPGGNKPIRSNTKTNKKNAQNNRGRHEQHPPKAKSHTQHPQDKHGKTPKPNHNQRARHRQSRPINRAGRLTRAPTHKPETSKT